MSTLFAPQAPPGLVNNGNNTCFINSYLQAFLAVPWMRGSGIQAFLGPPAELGDMARHIRDLALQRDLSMGQGSNNPLDPIALKKYIEDSELIDG